MKTKEELKALKEEVKTVSNKLMELSDDELKEVTSGIMPGEGKDISKDLIKLILQKIGVKNLTFETDEIVVP